MVSTPTEDYECSNEPIDSNEEVWRLSDAGSYFVYLEF